MTKFRQIIIILSASLHVVMSVFDKFEYEVPVLSNVKMKYFIQNYAGFGTYKYGYDTGSGPGQSFKHEERAENGSVLGRWGYIDPYGYLRVTEYLADATGYHILHQRIINLYSEDLIVKPPRPVKRPPGPFIGPLPPFIPRPPPEEI
ncbi:uncharacterized protein LOC143241008 [Tachypleus tridentatus]|uniref:uncharacterized protein LOC143241008 n=1 Tax=Tachypleus tridentatus TaxID=6853 RepID=UPI003FD5C83E